MNAAPSSELIIQEDITFGQQGRKAKLLTLATLAVAIIILIIGIALIAVAVKKDKDAPSSSPYVKGEHSTTTSSPTRIATSEPLSPTTKPSEACQLSEEAQKAELNDFLNRVKATYYKLHPYDVQYDPDVTTERVKTEYVAYDPTPFVIKNRTDTAWALLSEISSKKINPDALKPRERKALSQVKHYLKHVFGQPYDVNYYAGDWMMGPNLFCWQEICYQGYAVYNGLARHHKPVNGSDVLLIKTKLQTHRNAILQYIGNMKMGVRAGMIRSIDECIAGNNAIKRAYLNVSLYNETGVLKEWYVAPMLDSNFYSDISKETSDNWMKNHQGKNVSESVKDYLVTYLGKPLRQMLSYLENEHIRHCVPSNISSGLAFLPLKYVWLDGVENKSWPTTRTLPTHEPLNGSKAYSMIMSYFTTNDMTPLDVHQLGKQQLSILYPQVVNIAKQVSGVNDTQTAIEQFRQRLNSSSSYFNPSPIPKNESGEEAHKKCSDIEGAKKFCPKRWEALQLWFSESRKVMSMLEPKTIPLFYFTGEKATTPTCPVEMQPNLNPSSGAQSYQNSNPDCTKSAKYNIPFFLENLGPTFSEWSVNAHEARPGHHTQVQGNVEHFRDSCGGVIGWLDSVTYYTAFTEGWALYAENPLIAKDTDTYDNEPMQKFGMLKWQVWRALRLIVDTGLHYTGLTREGALKYFRDYAWDDTDLARKEVTRYQSDPGQATAYMIGQLVINEARKHANDALGKNFNLRDFHYQVLKQGSSPLAYLTDHVNKYIDCMKDNTKEGCDVILKPPKKTERKQRETKVQWPLIPRPVEHYF